MKYNDNGVTKNLYAKAVDTIPVGAILEYEGTTLPDGYERVDDTRIKKMYSTIVTNGKVLNLDSTSQTDTYSCNKVEDKFDEEVGNLSNLNTSDKTNVVSAVNEVRTNYGFTIGTTDNGSYIKYNNGILICYNKKNFGTINCATTLGSAFLSTTTTIKMPDFKDCFLVPTGNTTTVTTPAQVYLGSHESGNVTGVTYYYIAIGKWK
jgi:hypothetical protein